MLCRVAALSLAASCAFAANQIGHIEFFGYKGINPEAVRRALPFKPGDPVTAQIKQQARAAVKDATGRDATDVAIVCCEDDGGQTIFIGLAGESYHPFAYNPAPAGAARVSPQLNEIMRRLDKAMVAAVRKGGDAAREDDSRGYALSNDRATRALELSLHDYATKHEDELLSVLESSSDENHRQIAAQSIGYGTQTPRQIEALVRAARDPSDGVRNDATRAIGVLLRSDLEYAKKIPLVTFVQMMNSGIWTDRNKASSVLEPMSRSREPQVLEQIRTGVLDSLIEMARWKTNHAIFARYILARVAGISEDQMARYLTGPLDLILNRLHPPE